MQNVIRPSTLSTNNHFVLFHNHKQQWSKKWELTEEIRDVNKSAKLFPYQSEAPLFWAWRAPVITFGDNFMLTCLLMSWSMSDLRLFHFILLISSWWVCSHSFPETTYHGTYFVFRIIYFWRKFFVLVFCHHKNILFFYPEYPNQFRIASKRFSLCMTFFSRKSNRVCFVFILKSITRVS